jgi:hypothetical protein
VDWAASLTMASQSNSNVAFSRSPRNPMALSGSPSQLRLLYKHDQLLDGWLTEWLKNRRFVSAELHGRNFQQWRPRFESRQQLNVGWTDDSDQMELADWNVLTDLQPTTSYVVLVRAKNARTACPLSVRFFLASRLCQGIRRQRRRRHLEIGGSFTVALPFSSVIPTRTHPSA